MQMKNCGIIASGSPDPDDADDARCRADPLIMYLCKLGRNSSMQMQMKNLLGSPDPDDADDARCQAGPIITYFVNWDGIPCK